MKFFKKATLAMLALAFSACATSYVEVEPKRLNYVSNSEDDGVTLEYKYERLEKKYAKKSQKKDIRVVALKITNNTETDLVFGNDITLVYEDGRQVLFMEWEQVYRGLRQSTPTYLLYLLLSGINVSTSSGDGDTSSFPAGLIVGPGLTALNMITASSANKKFKEELMQYDLYGQVIKKGETVYGLIGISSSDYEALRVRRVR